MNKFRKLMATVFAVAMCFSVLTISARADQPFMQEAKAHLQAAINNLQKASRDKGGYRTQAISQTRQAFNETQKGIEYDRRN